jgi:hypothetical protein
MVVSLWQHDTARCRLLAAFHVLFGLHTGGVSAQEATSAIPADAAHRAIQRAESFVREVARLSPMPRGTDADRAQRWPRNRSYTVRLPGNNLPKDVRTRVYTRNQSSSVVVAPEYENDSVNGSAWQVRFYGGQVSVNINPTQGFVSGFHDSVLGDVLIDDPPPPFDQCITQETAIRRAAEYLRAAGMNLNELALRSVTLEDGSIPSSARTRKWYVILDRIWQGVPFDDSDQRVIVLLDAGKGRLIGFGSATVAPTPTEARLAISDKQALEIAHRHIAAKSLGSVVGESRVELKVRMLRDPQNPHGNFFPNRLPVSRLAWIVSTPVEDGVKANPFAWIWIDAATGEILSEEVVGHKGATAKEIAGGDIGITMRKAQRIEARPIPRQDTSKSESQALVLDAQKDGTRFYGAISGIIKPSKVATPSEKKPETPFVSTHSLTLTLMDSSQVTYSYDARTGMIASANGKTERERVRAGSALQNWLKPLSSSKQAVRK